MTTMTTPTTADTTHDFYCMTLLAEAENTWLKGWLMDWPRAGQWISDKVRVHCIDDRLAAWAK